MNTLAKKWVDFLKTNPAKHQMRLYSKDKKSRCCLGWALKFLEKKRGKGLGVKISISY